MSFVSQFADRGKIAGGIQKHASTLLLGLILLLAFFLRIWGIDFGLETGYSGEEPKYVTIALNMVKNGDFNPHWFQYPSLLFDLLATAYIPYFLFGVSQGLFSELADLTAPEQLFLGGAQVHYPSQILVGRAIMVALSVLTVLVVYLIGKKLYNEYVGLIAATFLAFSPIHALTSHFIQANVPMVFFIVLSFYFCLQVLDTGERKQYLWAGLCAGLAVSSKYNAVPVILVLVFAHLFRYGRRNLVDGNLLLGLAVCGLGFLLGTPYAIFDLPAFLDSMAYEVQHYSTGHGGHEGSAWLWYLKTLVADTEGIIPVLALGGGLWVLLRRDKAASLLLVFPISYYLLVSGFVVRFEWTLMPLIPFLDLLAAIFIYLAVSFVVARISSLKAATVPLLILLVLLALLVPGAKTIRRDYLLGQQDVRTTAEQWIEANIPAGSRILEESFGPVLDQKKYTMFYHYMIIGWPLASMAKHEIDYVIFSEPFYRPFFENSEQYPAEVELYETLFDELTLVKEFTGPFRDRIGTILIYAVP